MKNRIINVQDVPISISKQELDDYICITDIAKAKTGESRSADVVKNWLLKEVQQISAETCSVDRKSVV